MLIYDCKKFTTDNGGGSGDDDRFVPGFLLYLALLIGWMQFSKKIRPRNPDVKGYLAKAIFHFDFIPSYRVISRLCWVPNLIVAEMLVRRAQKHPEGASAEASAPFQGRYKAS